MIDPYRLVAPACVSFSGGRTSAYLLRKVLDAHGGTLPPGVHVLFANTGKEHPGTLDFVRDCGERWDVQIVWLEYDGRDGKGGRLSYREVTHATASRAGEPFAALIASKQALPNWGARWCTQELKVARLRAWMRVRGYESWTDAVGLRADEPRRVARIKGDHTQEVTRVTPLADAGVTVEDVARFWAAQPFDLAVPYGAGNCDLCFMKAARVLREQVRERPDLTTWWSDREAETGRVWNVRFTYAQLRARALMPVVRSSQLDLFDESQPDCACTD